MGDRRAWYVNYAIALTLAGLSAYVLIFYPQLPQEFGGVRPRCAYLDVERDKVSEAMLTALFPAGVGASANKVIRSTRISVLVVASDLLLGRPETAAPLTELRNYEIRRESVQGIEWCEPTQPTPPDPY